MNGQLCLAIWRGTAESFVNLGPVNSGLGTGLTNLTVRGISIEGNTLFLAGDADSQAVALKIKLLPPMLHLVKAQPSGGAQVVTLTWTNNGVPCPLESSDAPNSGWHSAGGLRMTNENIYSAVVTNTASARFFRLRGN